MSFLLNSAIYGDCCLFTIQDDAGRCVSIPSMLFDITDPRSSRFWLVRRNEVSSLTLWPEEFYKDFFHDRVTDGDPDALVDLGAVVTRLGAESSSKPGDHSVCGEACDKE
jgi:hypothetical protein